jgi:hypothetical protein
MNEQAVEFPFPELKPLWFKAVAEGLWFHSQYQDLWWSPEDIAKDWAKGAFRWSYVNWELRDPKERLAELTSRRDAAQKALEEFRSKLF